MTDTLETDRIEQIAVNPLIVDTLVTCVKASCKGPKEAFNTLSIAILKVMDLNGYPCTPEEIAHDVATAINCYRMQN